MSSAPPVPGLATLSPSRAVDFVRCPLAHRFRTVDRLPETPSAAAVRGTVVHRVLEEVFALEPAERTPERARGMLPAAWAEVLAAEPGAAPLFAAAEDEATWAASAAAAVDTWFTLEDPTRLSPAAREEMVEQPLGSGLVLRGIIDRVDVAPDGAVRIVDYKTGSSPPPEHEGGPLFQIRFYALAWWLRTGVVPRLLQLVYLGNGEVVSMAPDLADLQATRVRVEAIAEAIATARATGDWRPRPSRACDWCDFKALCPAWGGTPPALPPDPAPAVVDPVSAA